jgi:hypothetical protein
MRSLRKKSPIRTGLAALAGEDDEGKKKLSPMAEELRKILQRHVDETGESIDISNIYDERRDIVRGACLERLTGNPLPRPLSLDQKAIIDKCEKKHFKKFQVCEDARAGHLDDIVDAATEQYLHLLELPKTPLNKKRVVKARAKAHAINVEIERLSDSCMLETVEHILGGAALESGSILGRPATRPSPWWLLTIPAALWLIPRSPA